MKEGDNSMKLKTLIGSGDKIGLTVLPVIAVGLALNILYPDFFSVGGPPPLVKAISLFMLLPGIINWVWSVYLILTFVPRKALITHGPYSIVKHPLYTGVAFLVIPWVGFLFNTWLGIAVGLVMYAASRKFSPQEEKELSQIFGTAWEKYRNRVLMPWL